MNEYDSLNPLNMLTVLGKPASMLASQYGNVTYQHWCELELKRINAKRKRAFLKHRNGMVAIFLMENVMAQ